MGISEASAFERNLKGGYQMSVLHLLWIVPLAASIGGLAVGVVAAAADADERLNGGRDE